MMTLLQRMVVATAVIAFYLVAALSYRSNPPGAACFVAATAVLVFGAFVLSRGMRRRLNRAFFYFSLTLGSYLLAVYLLHMAAVWGIERVKAVVWLVRTGPLLIPPASVYVVYRFIPGRKPLLLVLAGISLVTVLPFVILNFLGLYITEYRLAGSTYLPANRMHLYRAWAVLTMFWVLVSAGLILAQAIRTRSRQRRSQYLLVVGGGAAVVVAGSFAFLPAFGQRWYPSFFGAAIAVFPIVLGFAVLRFALFDIKIVIRKTLPYAIGTAIIGVLYALVLGALQVAGLRLDILPARTNWIVLLVLVGFGFQPTLETMQTWLDRLFFRAEAELDQFLAEAGARYGSAGSPAVLARMMGEDARATLRLAGTAVLLGRETVAIVITTGQQSGLDRIRGSVMPDAPDRQPVLADEEGALHLGDEGAALSPELAGLGVQIAVPFGDAQDRGMLLGFRKLSDLPFSPRDVMFLRALATHAESALSRIRAQDKADVARRLTTAVLESMSSAVALVDEQDGLAGCNAAFEQAFGSCAGRSLQEIGLSEAVAPEAFVSPREIEARGRVYLASAKKLDQDGPGHTTILVLTDVTDLRRLQEADRRRAALADIGAMISSVNHEIMNILSPVNFYLDRAGRSREPDVASDALKAVRQRVDSLNALCRELREYYREPALSIRDVRLDSVVGSILSDMKAAAGDAWSAPKTSGLDISVRADPQKLKQVLLNVVKNAWEAMSGTTERNWAVRAAARGGKARIEVQDSGVGIKSEALDRVFEPFFSTKKERGTGLGLAIARRITEAHGAEIEVQSSLGRGTTVTLAWPAAG